MQDHRPGDDGGNGQPVPRRAAPRTQPHLAFRAIEKVQARDRGCRSGRVTSFAPQWIRRSISKQEGSTQRTGARQMKTLWKWVAFAVSMFSAILLLFAAQASAQAPGTAEARNVVLVHGAWADGFSWGEVISRLQAAGMHVTAVQNPLTSLADSAAATRRALALQDGPTVLVAHSWGGTVISETGLDSKVSARLRGSAGPRCGGGF